MVNIFNKKKHNAELWDFVKKHLHPDFYFTENNQRIFASDFSSYERMLRQSTIVLIHKEIDIDGVILSWKGRGGETERNYIKLNAINYQTANKLLSNLIWNYTRDFYVKIKKSSPYLGLFRDKGFIFIGGRGREYLLFMKKNNYVQSIR